ncbi:AGC/YANK protein kinase [Spizellomyces punctatus DAOM BR117]|uniref:AGC/YANK protein kinase n=1 Tax=Spizellomyces punctatus (strain DAOM BR117) TaxID=645134 RepID=A0A0L0H7N3_SPIPD|nr:AGC/YANK protein kinase [Spizellomyces punctatus DAOM BR117]KNC96698.1 AGC/YANK protein kinase [Spizellomyces punctatus DAOM BR117]|eukprot:XP_016604738.1 AGC/YANK protein kinase [Spizellomyces punctatus DAOM BR117]
MRATPNIFRERAILEEIEHPFVVNLRFAFQDDENMFMVMDLMMGGDLRFHVDRMGGFSEDAMKFITMELVCALDYLHRKLIVHRDLKPDNVLLDERGHVHITDFNIAVHYNTKTLTSQSGTLAYMAPEVFAGKGYSWPVDYWSLGVMLYECLFGKRPFRGHTDDQLKENICQGPIKIPQVNLITNKPMTISKECEEFLLRLLERDVSKRIGCGRMGVEEIQAHPWFRGIDWDAVERMKYPPPFVPDRDKANFDATYDLEELLLEDNPLTYRPRKKKQQPKQSPDKTHSAPLSQAPATKSRPHSYNVLSRIGRGGTNSPNPPAEKEKKKLSQKERLQMELDYIDQNFKLFDSSVFDRYTGFVNPHTLQVSDDVPSWVKNLDAELKQAQVGNENLPPPVPPVPSSLLGSTESSPVLSRSRRGSASQYKPPPPPLSERFSNSSSRRTSAQTNNFPPAGSAPSSQSARYRQSQHRPDEMADLSDYGRRRQPDAFDVVDAYAPQRAGLVPVASTSPSSPKAGSPPPQGTSLSSRSARFRRGSR